jgi:hypothetical protein
MVSKELHILAGSNQPAGIAERKAAGKHSLLVEGKGMAQDMVVGMALGKDMVVDMHRVHRK